MWRRIAWFAVIVLVPAMMGGGVELWTRTNPGPERLGPKGPLVPVLPSPPVPSQDAVSSLAPAVAAHVVPVFHPRPPAEWQGMLVRMDTRAFCQSTSNCGLAASCRNGLCGPCVDDAECAPAEVCVLDHCILRANTGCRSRRECSLNHLCILSGYSADPRNNSDLKSQCSDPRGLGTKAADFVEVKGLPSAPPSVDAETLQREAEQAALGSKGSQP